MLARACAGQLRPQHTNSKKFLHSKIESESIACLVCGHTAYKPHLSVPNRFQPEAGYPFQIVECTECGFRFLNPRPTRDAIGDFYQDEGYQPFVSAQVRKSLWDRTYDFVRVCALRGKRIKIEKLKNAGTILDVGCGTGEFLHEMKSSGWQAAGVEKDSKAAEFARNSYGIDVRTDELEDCNFDTASFDLVTMWHALEHVFSPKTTLHAACNLMKPDGILLVAVPNIASRDAAIYGRHWVALDTPRHLSHFTPDSIKHICGLVGLRVIEVRQMVLDAFYNCLLSEQLRNVMCRRRQSIIGWFVFRAILNAILTVLGSTRLRSAENRLGSSNLYIIQKAEEKC